MQQKHVPHDQKRWNALAMVGFIAIFLAAFFFVAQNWGTGIIENLGVFDVVLIALAAQRLTRLASHDKISGFVREWFLDSGDGEELVKPPSGFRRLMAELIECIWCTSMWAALFSLVFYLSGPIGKFAVIMLAVSSVAMLTYNCSLALSRLGDK